MERQDVLVLGWMLLVFAVGSFVFTPLDGLVLALVLGFGFSAALRLRSIHWAGTPE